MATVRQWDSAITLHGDERAAVQELGALVAARPLPAKLAQLHKSDTRESSEGSSADSLLASGGEIQSAQAFLSWFATIHDELVDELDEGHRAYASRLVGFRTDCESLLGQLDTVHTDLRQMLTLFDSVTTKTSELHRLCSALVREKAALGAQVESIRARLAYFDSLDDVSKLLSRPQIDVSSEPFLSALRRVDECLLFLAEHASYKDATAYSLRFRALQNRFLSLIREFVVRKLKDSSAEIVAAIRARAEAAPGDETETSLLYVQYRAVAPGIRPLIGQLEARAGSRREYESVLDSLREAYFSQRLALLAPVIARQLAALDMTDVLAATRHGSLALLRLCQLELNLYTRFFAVPTTAELDAQDAPVAEFAHALGAELCYVLRPLIIRINELATLADLCAVLKVEVLEGHIGAVEDASGSLFAPTVIRLLNDAQARLVYRAQSYVRDAIIGFHPKPDELAYPALLVAAREAASLRDGAAAPAVVAADSSTADNAHARAASVSLARLREPLAGIYPPLERTLSLIARLHRAVDAPVFAGIAREAIWECTDAIYEASRSVSLAHSAADGALFAIRHLLVLREQISPFHIEFRTTERSLDFSPLSSGLAGLLQSGRSLFSLTSENVLVSLVTRTAPDVVEQERDAKKHLDARLKTVCEAYIALERDAALAPVLAFVERARAYAAAKQSVRSQPFGSVDAVRAVVQAGETALGAAVPQLAARLALYLHSPVTHAVIVKPIRAAVVDAYAELAAALSDYTAEERAAIAVPLAASVVHLFDEALARGATHGLGTGPRVSAAAVLPATRAPITGLPVAPNVAATMRDVPSAASANADPKASADRPEVSADRPEVSADREVSADESARVD